jgi:tetratricopeptide (TPR) repeat protein
MNGAPSPRHDLFISLAETDAAWVRHFLLPALNLPPGRAVTTEDFPPGSSRRAETERAVSESRYTVLVFSPEYLRGAWAEFSGAVAAIASIEGLGGRVVPILLRECPLPLFERALVSLDCTQQERWEPEVAKLRALLERPTPPPEQVESPYPGLTPFGPEQSRLFFGRHQETAAALARLRAGQRTLYVIGPSGSGKTSLVLAGLVPGLATLPGTPWRLHVVRPGARPSDRVAEALGGTAGDPLGGVGVGPADDRHLLVIDPFEEVYTQASREEQAEFFKLIRDAAAIPTLTVVVLMRADFYPDLMNCPLWTTAQAQRLEIAALNGESLRESIEAPAREAGIGVEARLLDRLTSDAAAEPGALPLLQVTLTDLWHRRRRRLMTLEDYERLGAGHRSGLAVAIRDMAEAALGNLTSEGRDAARRVFLRLVSFGEGRADTRRQESLAILERLPKGDPDFVRATVRALADARLLTLGGEPGAAGCTVDIAHEALISAWPTLQRWLAEGREAERTSRRFESKAREWIELGRGDGGLLDEVELRDAERWLASPDAALAGPSDDLADLIAKSRAARQRRTREARVRRLVFASLLGAIGLAAGYGYYMNYQARNYRAGLSRAAIADYSLALAELGADRFASAEAILSQAIERLGSERQLDDQRTRLARRRDEVGRIVRFYAFADESEWLELSNYDEGAAATCQAALDQLAIGSHPDWWTHLPAADLLARNPGQLERLQESVYRELLLLAMIKAKSGIKAKSDILHSNKPEAASAFREALKVGAAARRFRPQDAAGSLLEYVCHSGLGESNPKDPLPDPNPRSATDYYFIGYCHSWIVNLPQDSLTRWALSRAKSLRFLDLKTSKETAEQYLRTAASLDPRHYWSHAMLGGLLSGQQRYADAELAHGTCVSLRPQSAMGYTWRAYDIAAQVNGAKDATLRARLVRRAIADLERCIALKPKDPEIFESIYNTYIELGRMADAIKAASRRFELEPPRRSSVDWSVNDTREMIEAFVLELEKTVANMPPSAEASAALAHGYLLLENDDRALEAAAKSLELRPGQFRALAVRGEVALKRHLPQEALAEFDRALAQAPGDYHIVAGRARAEESLGRLEAASTGFEHALQAAETRWQQQEALRALARVLDRLGRHEEARRQAQRAEQLGPVSSAREFSDAVESTTMPSIKAGLDDPTVLTIEGEVCLQRGEYGRAILLARRAALLEPTYARAYGCRASAYSARGQNARAVSDWDEAIRLAPNWSYLYYLRGGDLLRLGELDLAFDDFEEAIRRGTNDARAYAGRAFVFQSRGEYESALTDLDRAIALNGDTGWLYGERADVRLSMGDWEKAIADCDQAIHLAPDLVAAYHFRADARRHLKQYELAEADFAKALALAPDNAQIHECEGFLWYDRRNYEKAIGCFTAALSAEPRYRPALVSRGNAYDATGENERALADYSKAIDLDPGDASTYNRRGNVQFRLGAFRDAIDDYGKAIQRKPDFADAFRNRSNAWSRVGRYQEALSDAVSAVELGAEGAMERLNRAAAKLVASADVERQSGLRDDVRRRFLTLAGTLRRSGRAADAEAIERASSADGFPSDQAVQQ